MFNKLIKYLSSLRFTILLICLLGMIFAIGLWVPQKRLLKTIYLAWQAKSPALVAFLDSLGLTTIYTSPITITLWLLFFLNLSLVLWQRIPLVKSRITLSETKITDPVTSGGYPFRGSYPLPDDVSGAAVVGLLDKRGFAMIGNESGFYGVKNRLAPIAFMLFHLSFFLILLGGLISVYTEFIGYVDLAQGESFQGELHRYNVSPSPKMPEIGSPPEIPITVKSIVPQVVKNTPTSISVLLADKNGQTHEVGINTPYTAEHTSFVFKHLGVSPLFVLKDASGKEIQGAYIKLDVLQRKPDKFALDAFTFTATFYPDFVMEDGKRASRTMEFNNPVFFIVAEQGGKKIGEGLVPKNGSLDFAGYRLEMRDMPFWVRFYVVKERGLSILYAGFAIATIGVIWRLLFYRREIIGAVREQDGVRCLVVAGRSEYYKSLAEDEFTKMFGEMFGDRLKVEG
jgi:hypothetical protein